MATIVKLKNSETHAVLVGVGYGMFKSSRPNALFGDLLPTEKEGNTQMAAVSTSRGDVLWCPSDGLTVVSVDGVSPSELLTPYFTKKPISGMEEDS